MFEYSCIVKEPTGKDAGKYKCVAMNQFGEATANVNLNIETEPDPQGEPPTFIGKPEIKWEGGSGRVLMIALVKADPKPSAIWSKMGVTIKAGSKHTMTVTEERTDVYSIQMELRKPQPADGGIYKCNIKNEFGELNANLNLNIEVAPSIKRQPTIVKIEEKKVLIESTIMSSSKPSVSWIKDNKELDLKINQHYQSTITETGE